jgi:ketosteroid isomerase-like protein
MALNPAAESEIRSIIEGWAHAIRTRDSKALASHLAPSVIIYDLIAPLRFLGSAAVGDRAEQWLSTFEGPVHYEVRDLAIAAGDDVAFYHSLNHVDGARKTEPGSRCGGELPSASRRSIASGSSPTNTALSPLIPPPEQPPSTLNPRYRTKIKLKTLAHF